MIILLFGPPGCGKGTQAALISRRFRIPAISTGEIFRAECAAGTPLGNALTAILANGDLVEDAIVDEVVVKRISRPDCRSGFLLDGYPRTVPQATFLDCICRQRGLRRPVAIHLNVPADVLVSRLAARRQCPNCSRLYNLIYQPPNVDGICDTDGCALIRRQDDFEEVIRQRLKAYQELTNPVLAWYADCRRVDGTGSPDEIFRNIEQLLLAMPSKSVAELR